MPSYGDVQADLLAAFEHPRFLAVQLYRAAQNGLRTFLPSRRNNTLNVVSGHDAEKSDGARAVHHRLIPPVPA
jgi:hypothetical protein